MTLKRKVGQGPSVNSEDVSLIDRELTRYSAQVNEILASLESINLLSIQDPEDRLKATISKQNVALKLPILLQGLDDLRTRAKLKSEDIRGSKNISLLESGALE